MYQNFSSVAATFANEVSQLGLQTNIILHKSSAAATLYIRSIASAMSINGFS